MPWCQKILFYKSSSYWSDISKTADNLQSILSYSDTNDVKNVIHRFLGSPEMFQGENHDPMYPYAHAKSKGQSFVSYQLLGARPRSADKKFERNRRIKADIIPPRRDDFGRGRGGSSFQPPPSFSQPPPFEPPNQFQGFMPSPGHR